MNSDNKTESTKERLFTAGAELFAEKGFDSVSVREICKAAGTSMNMIHHYYDNKQGLLDAIVDTFAENVFAFPIRLLSKDVQNEAEFISRLELFFEETLNALIENRLPLLVVQKHQTKSTAMSNLLGKFVQFVAKAQNNGFVQTDIEPELMSGFLMDRLATQVLYAPLIAEYSGYDLIGDPDYRARWVQSNLKLFLYGLVKR